MTGRRPTPTSTTRRDRGKRRVARLSGAQITGGGLAALTAAVTASYLGVTGTVIGAAVMSVATTVGTEFYAHLLRRTGHRVKQHATPSRRTRPSRDDAPAGREVRAGGDPAGYEASGDDASACGAPAGGDHIGGAAVGEASADEGSAGGPAFGGGAWPHVMRGRLGWLRVGAVLALVVTVSFGGVLIYQAFSGQMAADQGNGTSARKAKSDKRHAPDRDRRAARGSQQYVPVQSGPPATPSSTGPSASPTAVIGPLTNPSIGPGSGTTGPDAGALDGTGSVPGDVEGIGAGGAVNGTAPPGGSAPATSAPPPGSSTTAPLEAPEAALPDTAPSTSTAPGRPHAENPPAPTRPATGEDGGNRHR
ncbi:hypothetical protein GCM10009733_055380 [Nonomuraea maheshkhaliensis]|uniref:Uncharacterized protein n=1 Tax=Nonomuraea maheshkhaliensis TaxID=419590 RepID=A0ABP4RJB4_9ACTN